MPEIKRCDRRGADQDVFEMYSTEDRAAVRRVSGNRAFRITIEAANVQWHFVVEQADPAADDCTIRASRRPGETRARPQIIFVSDALTLEYQTEVDTEICLTHPA